MRELESRLYAASARVDEAAHELALPLVRAAELMGRSHAELRMLADIGESLRAEGRGVGRRLLTFEWSEVVAGSAGSATAQSGRVLIDGGSLDSRRAAQGLLQILAAGEGLSDRDRSVLFSVFGRFMREGHTGWADVQTFLAEQWANTPLYAIYEPYVRLLGHRELLDDIDVWIAGLESQVNDGGFLAATFDAVGPEGVLELVELLSLLGFAQSTAGSFGAADVGVSELEVQDLGSRLSRLLGAASLVRSGSRYALDDAWFESLFAAGTSERSGLFGGKSEVIDDGLPVLFASGMFRRDVAVRAGSLGMRIINGDLDVAVGKSAALYSGFEQIDVDREARVGALLAAAARWTDVAGDVLLAEYEGGRSGIEILASHDFDTVAPDRVVDHYRRMLDAATTQAERLAIVDGLVVDAPALERAWRVRTELFDAIIRNEGQGQYPVEINRLFTAKLIEVLPHALNVGLLEAVPYRVTVGSSVPGKHSGIWLDTASTGELFGVLMRDTESRQALASAVAATQRMALVAEDRRMAVESAGVLQGWLVGGAMRADLASASELQAEITAANQQVDALFSGGKLALASVDRFQLASKGYSFLEVVLAGLDVEGFEDRLKNDASHVEQASERAVSSLYEADWHLEEYVFALGFEQMQMEFREFGTEGLSETSLTIFRELTSVDDLDFFVPGETSIADIKEASIGARQWYLNVADRLTTTEGNLRMESEIAIRGMARTRPELSLGVR